MNIKSIVLVIASLVVLVGCAGPHKYDPSQSEAWNMTRAADIKLRDTDPEEIEKHAGNKETGLTHSVALGGLSYLSPPPGISSGLAGGLGLIGPVLLGSPRSSRSWIVSFVPKSEAATKEKAFDLARERMRNSVKAVITDDIIPDPYYVAKTDFTHERHQIVMIGGGNCSGKVREHTVDDKYICMIASSIFKLSIEDTVSPGGVLPKKESWLVLARMESAIIEAKKWNSIYKPGLPEVKIYSKLSESLPSWSYVYLSANRHGYITDDGEKEILPFPLVLHKGEPYYFIAPES